MAIAQTLEFEVTETPTTLFTASDQNYMILGGILSNRQSTPAYVTLKRDDKTFLLNTKIEQGIPFQLASKIVLEQPQSLIAYASDSPVSIIWNNNNPDNWNDTSVEDWNTAGIGNTSVLLTLTLAGIGV